MLGKGSEGIGFSTGENLKCLCGLPINIKKPIFYIKDFSFLLNTIYKVSRVELKIFRLTNIKFVKKRNIIKSFLFEKNLPVRGQRNHKNAKTRKKRRVV